jgi:WD40 repeat protein/serine/threonine protein kinase
MSSFPANESLATARCELDERRRRFEEAWQAGQPPAFEPFLPEPGPTLREMLIALVKIDLDHRWRRKSAAPADATQNALAIPRLEDYVVRHPALGPIDGLPLELIVEEYRVRRRWGDRPEEQEFARRFPQHGAELLQALRQADQSLDTDFAGSAVVSASPASSSGGRTAITQIIEPLTSVSAALEVLRETGILTMPQLNQLIMEDLQGKYADAAALAQELGTRGWLNQYQIDQLLQGHARELALGPYIVLDRLGEGGAGQVFKARHQRMDRLVALKVIRKELLTDKEAIGRFYREIQVASQLKHPNLVHAYDAGPLGDLHFLAMEYVEGIDLARLVKQQGPLPVEQACDYIRQAGLGLHYTHSHGLVHRDIKPSNLFVTDFPAASGGCESPGDMANQGTDVPRSPAHPWGTVKILDLGLARLQPRTEEDGTTSFLTNTGAVMMGTLDYMAPEQALDFHGADIRADIYSLGCTLYHLLTGRPPFAGGTPAQKLLYHQQMAPPPIEEVRQDVPPAVLTVLAKLLAKHCDERYQTPLEVVQALAPASLRHTGDNTAVISATASATFDFEDPGVPVPTGRVDLRSVLVGVGAVMALVIGFVVVLAVSSRRSTVVVHRSEEPGSTSTNIVKAVPEEQAPPPVATPEGPSPFSLLKPVAALPWDWPANQRQDLVAILGESAGRHWAPVHCLAFSADGKLLASGSADHTVRLWDPNTLAERGVLTDVGKTVLTLSFDSSSRLLASLGGNNTFRVWDMTVPEPKPLELPLELVEKVAAVAFSPTGPTLGVGYADGAVRLWDLSEVKPRMQLRIPAEKPGGRVTVLAFSADGHMLGIGGEDRTVKIWDLQQNQKIAALADPIAKVTRLAFSEDGSTLAYRLLDRSIHLWTFKGARTTTLPPVGWQTARGGGLAYAPATNTLVAGGDKVLGVFEWKGDTIKQLPEMKDGSRDQVITVAFSNDGRLLAAGHEDGHVRVWKWGTPPVLVGARGHMGKMLSVAISHDGRFVAGGSGDTTIYLWKVDEGQARLVAPLRHYVNFPRALAFAPDNKQLANGATTGQVRLWGPLTRNVKKMTELQGDGDVLAASYIPNSSGLAAACNNGTVWLWKELGSAPQTRNLVSDRVTLPAMALAADCRSVIYAHVGTVWWAETQGDAPPRRVSKMQQVTALALSPDGQTVALANHAGLLRICTVKGENPKQLSGKGPRVNALAFAPDGKRLAAASDDGTIVIWAARAGMELKHWRLSGPISALAFAPDGKHLLTANHNGTIYVIRAE